MYDWCRRPLVTPSVSYRWHETRAIDKLSSHAVIEYVPGSFTKCYDVVSFGYAMKSIAAKCDSRSPILDSHVTRALQHRVHDLP